MLFYLLLFLLTSSSGDPWCDEGHLPPDQAETVPCGESYCLHHSTCLFSPCLGSVTLQTGERRNPHGPTRQTHCSLCSGRLQVV